MMNRKRNPQVLVLSAIMGALVGIAAGMTLLKRVESEEEERPLLTAAEGMSLGMLVVGLLRQLTQLGNKKEASGALSKGYFCPMIKTNVRLSLLLKME